MERSRPEVIVKEGDWITRDEMLDSQSQHGQDTFQLKKLLHGYWRYTSKPEIPNHFFEAPAEQPDRYPGFAVLVKSDSPLLADPLWEEPDAIEDENATTK